MGPKARRVAEANAAAALATEQQIAEETATEEQQDAGGVRTPSRWVFLVRSRAPERCLLFQTRGMLRARVPKTGKVN
jgi:hypothetical protein